MEVTFERRSYGFVVEYGTEMDRIEKTKRLGRHVSRFIAQKKAVGAWPCGAKWVHDLVPVNHDWPIIGWKLTFLERVR